MTPILLPGIRGESLLGFLAGLGTLRVLAREFPEIQLSWSPAGGGWIAQLHVPADTLRDADHVSEVVFAAINESRVNHPVLQWARFLGKTFDDQSDFFRVSADADLTDDTADRNDFAAVFSSQVATTGETPEHFDHPFRAARKDYYLGNLESVLANTQLSHVHRTIARPWDYQDAMDNQSLRLDHGDDRRHAYQWHAPSTDPIRKKVGCMLGANRLAIEAFPLFPCIPGNTGNTAIGFICSSKTYTWVSWPIWTAPCSITVVSSLLNMDLVHHASPSLNSLEKIGIVAVFRSRRLPIEKNKVFQPPVAVASYT